MVGLQAQATPGVVRIRHQESTSIAGLTTQTIYKQFADWANDNKHKYINKKARLESLAFCFILLLSGKTDNVVKDGLKAQQSHSPGQRPG
jgi:hypothetical protein